MAGGILNVTRTVGTSLGVAVAATVLSWRLAVGTGHPESTLHAPRALLLGAVHDTLLVLAGLALVAAGVSLVRGGASATRTAPGKRRGL
ncbi:MAG: hypothetical protein NVSMB65_11090 [Chloroflexota bacterium]